MFELNHWLYQNPLIVALIAVFVVVLSVLMKKKLIYRFEETAGPVIREL